MADAYRFELHPWGIDSVLVEPGIYTTPIFDKALKPTDLRRLETYGPNGAYVDQVSSVFAAAMADPANPGSREVVETIAQLIEMPRGSRPFRSVVGAQVQPLLAAYNDTAESLRPVVASVFGVTSLIG